MALFPRLQGIVGSIFQLGGPSGSGVKNNAGAIEARNSGDSAYVVSRGADPVGNDDLTTLRYFNAHGISVGTPSPGTSFTAVSTEQSCYVRTISAGLLVVGSSIRFDLYGFATQTAAAVTLTGRIRVGAVGSSLTGAIVATDKRITAATAKTSTPFHVTALCTVRSTGSGGTILGGMSVGGAIFDGGAVNANTAITAAVAINTTIAQDIAITLQPSATTWTAVTITNCTAEIMLA